jgi:hypothetical protein
MGCFSLRHRSYHENICSGLAVNLLLAQNSANGNSNAAADNHDDRQFDADDGGNASGFSGWASDSSVESSSDESEKFERNERQRVQHAKELVDAAISTFEAYGSDKCTFDFADYIIRRSLGVRGGTELMGLLHRHGINHGKGLHEKCSTYSKLNSILDADPSLPFTKHLVSSSLYPDLEHALFTRNILSCVTHLWHEKDFDGRTHVKPCREKNVDGKRVISEFFTGQFVKDTHDNELDDGDVLMLLILHSDKTHQDVLGVHEAYPVYLYLGNVDTDVRTKANHAGLVLGVCVLNHHLLL